MHPNVARVTAAAAERGMVIDVREFPDGTRTAAEAAAAVGVEVGQIVKSLAFVVDGEVVMALVSGADRLDERRLAAAAGTARSAGQVQRPDADRVRAATGYPIGGVPPFGHATQLRTFVDEALLGHPVVWAAAGTPHHVFAVTPNELVRLSEATVADLAAR